MFKRFPSSGALVLALIAAIVVAPLTAFAAESHVWVNNTSGKGVWVTAFTRNCPFEGPNKEAPAKCTDRHIVHEWCVHPASTSKQGFHVRLTVLHLLVTSNVTCGRPVIKDWTLSFPPSNGSQVITRQYTVSRHALNGIQVYEIKDTTP